MESFPISMESFSTILAAISAYNFETITGSIRKRIYLSKYIKKSDSLWEQTMLLC